MMPLTLRAAVFISGKNVNSHIIRNESVVCRKLAQRFQHINSIGKSGLPVCFVVTVQPFSCEAL